MYSSHLVTLTILSIILNYFKHYIIDFDVYVIADTQERTKYLYPSEYPHADESEFFSREEFAEIASAIFYVFGYVRVFYSEMEFIEYFIQNKLCPKQFVVYNFARDGQANGKKSLIPAFCDLMNIRYTGSNCLSLLQYKHKEQILVSMTYSVAHCRDISSCLSSLIAFRAMDSLFFWLVVFFSFNRNSAIILLLCNFSINGSCIFLSSQTEIALLQHLRASSYC